MFRAVVLPLILIERIVQIIAIHDRALVVTAFRQLPDDSRAWYEALRDLRSVKRDLRRLRQVSRYCASLQVADATRRKLDGLTSELERKIDYCRRWEDEDY